MNKLTAVKISSSRGIATWSWFKSGTRWRVRVVNCPFDLSLHNDFKMLPCRLKMLPTRGSVLQSHYVTSRSVSSRRKCERPRDGSYHEYSTQTDRRVTLSEKSLSRIRTVFPFSTADSPLLTRPAMLTALRKSGRRLPPSLRPGTRHPIAMTSDCYYHRLCTEVREPPVSITRSPRVVLSTIRIRSSRC
jgi:hypothetical protein